MVVMLGFTHHHMTMVAFLVVVLQEQEVVVWLHNFIVVLVGLVE